MRATTYDTAAAIWVSRTLRGSFTPEALDPAKISNVRFGTIEGDGCPTCGYDGYGAVFFAYDGAERHASCDEIPFGKLVEELVAIAHEVEAA